MSQTIFAIPESKTNTGKRVSEDTLVPRCFYTPALSNIFTPYLYKDMKNER
ncbi:hypothetical protein HMPREF0658_1551 [Hoylesella marshii DSM 16973 = JCM 13450]|uniref:Uncharacterized protein n=1 Tax=Hoylesella marshii DSM 16973 = JCM 13450 TaxID=862515 RepID=E0NTP8_9BACT|nr:hypothetical protein HMPREF0658_1551 [Hoylesella marshii DSM 16973 = JCM 13450]